MHGRKRRALPHVVGCMTAYAKPLGKRSMWENVMTTKPQWRTLLSAGCLALAVIGTTARAAEIPLVTGEQWTTSSEETKKAYLVGIANLVSVERAYSASNPAGDAQTFVPRFSKGLQGQTLDSVREGLNKWYAANPARLQRPVVETIWFEMVVPGLQKKN
jgi:hypothetical protein